MHVLFEEDGGFKAATILTQTDSSLQVETPHGKRIKLKSANVLMRFEAPAASELMARADRLVRLSRIFRAYLPPHLRDHAALVRLDEDGWVVHADSSSWATRLRYALHNIRETLGQELGFALPKPHIRVVPAALPPPSRPPMTLTERNAKLLEVAARNLSDERLSAALRRLAAYADPARAAPERGR